MASRLLQFLSMIATYIYDLVISNFLTKTAHVSMLPHMNHCKGRMLDVGCGTGAPLKEIYPELQKHYESIVGLDLHEGYTRQAMKNFADKPDVSIYHMDFYDLNKVFPTKKFDFILFSFSFMLMPNPVQAIRVATESLNTNSRIAFILTLNQKENRFLQKLKPLIHKLTTIDFGNVVYEKQFE